MKVKLKSLEIYTGIGENFCGGFNYYMKDEGKLKNLKHLPCQEPQQLTFCSMNKSV